MKLDDVLQFCELVLQFRSVDRVLPLPFSEENENDVEHSYMLAMVSWYLVSKYQLELNLNLVLKYALTHDLVEVYAGDTYIYDSTKTETKQHRESAAAKLLRDNFPDFDEAHNLIEAYEKRTDPESRFVYALDKILPVIIIFLGEGQAWHQYRISLEMLREQKDHKIAESEILSELWQELTKRLEKQPELFPNLKEEAS